MSRRSQLLPDIERLSESISGQLARPELPPDDKARLRAFEAGLSEYTPDPHPFRDVMSDLFPGLRKWAKDRGFSRRAIKALEESVGTIAPSSLIGRRGAVLVGSKLAVASDMRQRRPKYKWDAGDSLFDKPQRLVIDLLKENPALLNIFGRTDLEVAINGEVSELLLALCQTPRVQMVHHDVVQSIWDLESACWQVLKARREVSCQQYVTPEKVGRDICLYWENYKPRHRACGKNGFRLFKKDKAINGVIMVAERPGRPPADHDPQKETKIIAKAQAERRVLTDEERKELDNKRHPKNNTLEHSVTSLDEVLSQDGDGSTIVDKLLFMSVSSVAAVVDVNEMENAIRADLGAKGEMAVTILNDIVSGYSVDYRQKMDGTSTDSQRHIEGKLSVVFERRWGIVLRPFRSELRKKLKAC